MPDVRTTRIAENEMRFREINERLQRDLTDVLDPGEPMDLVCECGFDSSRESVSMAVAEYEAVRSDGRRFLLVPGHEINDVERVVEERPGYRVVEKVGESATLTTERDPRLG
jgi:hypothetical protein